MGVLCPPNPAHTSATVMSPVARPPPPQLSRCQAPGTPELRAMETFLQVQQWASVYPSFYYTFSSFVLQSCFLPHFTSFVRHDKILMTQDQGLCASCAGDVIFLVPSSSSPPPLTHPSHSHVWRCTEEEGNTPRSHQFGSRTPQPNLPLTNPARAFLGKNGFKQV